MIKNLTVEEYQNAYREVIKKRRKGGFRSIERFMCKHSFDRN
jgi:hypothetical protein